MAVPKYDDLYNPLLKALHELGGSAAVSEMDEKVAEILKLTEKEINEIHIGNRTSLSYRLAWARNYLKRYGLLENSARGVWALTTEGLKINEVDKKEVNKYVKQLDYETGGIEEEVKEGKTPESGSETWEEELLTQILLMDANAFERLCQRILRESGFIQVQVTGKSGDGGIDGKGMVRLGGLISFRVVFQCKRWKGSVPSKEIRDFRGAMDGRADRGLFITTGTFSRDAKDEASRDGAFPIELIDGEVLVQKMKELNLGVKVSMKEEVEIDKEWFSKFSG